MEIKIEEEDLIRLLKEYVTHYGFDLTNKDIQITFMAGRKHASYALIKILEPEDTFVSSTAISLATDSKGSTDPIDVEKKEEQKIEKKDTKEEINKSPEPKVKSEVKVETEPKKAGRPKGSTKKIEKKETPTFTSGNSLGNMLGFDSSNEDIVNEEKDTLEQIDSKKSEVTENSKSVSDSLNTLFGIK